MKKFLIIGGGASGLAAAVTASECGAKVTVLEQKDRVGKKLLATGNGRCNLANAGELCYFGQAEFASAVFKVLPVRDVTGFFSRLGLTTATEDSRIYPACMQAAAVLDVLRMHMERLHVDVRVSTRATQIKKEAGGFRMSLSDGSALYADSVLVACGGMAQSALGSDGSGYALLQGLGHTMSAAPAPALTQLICDKQDVRGLAGLRLPVVLTLCDGIKPLESAGGEMLFTQDGVSGVCAMQLSRTANKILLSHGSPVLYADFSCLLGLEEKQMRRLPVRGVYQNTAAAEKLLASRRKALAGIPTEQFLTGLAPRLLAQRLGHMDMKTLAKMLTAYPLHITAVRGFDSAQVTSGGIDPREFDPDTMQSRLVKNLYAAGEVLDVDGDCGGYNLQFAFATGILAGRQQENEV